MGLAMFSGNAVSNVCLHMLDYMQLFSLYPHAFVSQVHFENVKFIEPQRWTITLTNTGQVVTSLCVFSLPFTLTLW